MFSTAALTSRSRLVFSGVLGTLACLGGCSSNSSPATSTTTTTPTPVATTTDPLASVVFLGDSLTAGFQNGSLLDTQQTHGYANLLATQAGFSIVLPLVAPPGYPAVLTLESAGELPVLGQASGTTSGRDNPTQQPTDLAVPGATLDNLIYTTPSANGDIFTGLVLGLPTGNSNSQAAEAVALKPSTIILWIGNNDALGADVLDSPSALTSLSSFTTDFTLLMTGLKSKTTAHLVVANIPDVTSIAYMTPAVTVLAAVASQTGLTQAEAGQQLGIAAGDLVNEGGIGDVETALSGYEAGGTLAPLSDGDVLTASEILSVQAMINSYNQVIAQQVSAAGGTLVDLHAFYQSLAAGVTINGYTATTGYLGGLFSLDGMHPTNTGYALLANQFITSLNSAFSLTIPAVNVEQVAASDPYFGPNIKPVGAVSRIPRLAAHRTNLLVQQARQR